MIGIPHRYLTAELPGVGGRIKGRFEDFIVEEIPLYHPADQGEHTFFEVEKTDLSTLEALERIARGLAVDRNQFGFAGLKDRKGITRQCFSVRLVPPERVLALELNQLRVLWARLHGNKLRVGHLRGNRFHIRIRGVEPDRDRIAAILGRVGEAGIPNFYGPQRFGTRGDAYRIGRALLQGDCEEAVRRLLGFPQPSEHNPDVVEARRHFMAGDLAAALEKFPGSYREEKRLVWYLIRSSSNYRGAVRQLGDSMKKLYFSAYQSYLFNRILDRRLAETGGDLARLYPGDLAWIHRNGAVFRVEDPAREEPRARGFEISPSGPVFGKKMVRPGGFEEEIESEFLAADGIAREAFHRLMPGFHMEGGRRPLRVPVRELSFSLEGEDLLLEFFLTKGSYATTLLRELMKNEEVPPGYGEETAAAAPGEVVEHDLEADDEPAMEGGGE